MRVEVPVPVRICLLVAKRERGSCVVSTGPRGRRGPTEGGGRRASRRTRSRSPWPPTWSAYRRRSSQRLPLSLTPRPARRDGPTRTAYDRTRGAHGTTPRMREGPAAGRRRPPFPATGQPLSEDDSPLAGSAFAPSALASAPTAASSGAPCSTAPPPASPLSAAGGAPPSTAGPPIGSVCRLESTMAATTTPTASTVMPTRSHVLPAYV